MKIISFLISIGIILLSITSCNGILSDPLFPKNMVVEYGETVTFDRSYDVEVKDSMGNLVRLQYGSFFPEVGTYNVVCVADGTKYNIEIVCKDTIAPKTQFEKHLINAESGESVELPKHLAEDKAGIKSTKITVFDGEENQIMVSNNCFTVNKGIYKIIISAEDNNGNVAKDEAHVFVHEKFFDETLTEGVLATFDKQAYMNMLYAVDEVESFSGEILDGRLVLTSDAEYTNVYSTIRIPKRDFDFSQTASVFVKLKVDRPTDYVKIVSPMTGKIAGAVYYLEKDKDYTIAVDPVILGYSTTNSFKLMARTSDGIVVSVDEVTYTENKLDTNYNGIECFDDEMSLSRVFQNIYTTQYFLGNGSILDGGHSKFSIADKYFYGESTPISVLRVETTENRGGFTYLLQKIENIDEVDSISITISHEQALSQYSIGVFHDDYKMADYVKKASAGAINERVTITIPVSEFRSKCDTKLMGIWLGTVNRKNEVITLNVESIRINYHW